MSSQTPSETATTWHPNVGESGTIHAKRISGRFRTIKWLTASLWLFLFIGPYLRWEGRQALLIDLPSRQFHIYGLTVHPHDIWVLTFIMIFFAMLLVAATLLAGRVFCGYFCFQTAWTDLYTWIEEKIEGQPRARHALDNGPWNINKLSRKGLKHGLWLAIAMLTGVSFAAWFTDAFQLWSDYFSLQAHISAWVTLGMFTVGTYLLAGFMREQVCFWLCPYARIQGVLSDHNSVLPTYDYRRGEPRGKRELETAVSNKGDCVDCDQCLVVCPTGIDIRDGQQLGCITCGLCIDACNSVMKKIDRSTGLIRYASLNEMQGSPQTSALRRPMVLVSLVMLITCVAFVAYGLTSITPIEVSVEPERQPMFVKMSDGSIQNSYHVRIFNKGSEPSRHYVTLNQSEQATLVSPVQTIVTKPGAMSSVRVFVKIPQAKLDRAKQAIIFTITNADDQSDKYNYQSYFSGPER